MSARSECPNVPRTRYPDSDSATLSTYYTLSPARPSIVTECTCGGWHVFFEGEAAGDDDH